MIGQMAASLQLRKSPTNKAEPLRVRTTATRSARDFEQGANRALEPLARLDSSVGVRSDAVRRSERRSTVDPDGREQAIQVAEKAAHAV